MNYNFIEIGTSDFRTLIEKCEDDTFGISVEAIKYYLDKLPNKKNVMKVNKAITGDKVTNEKIKIYYIPENVIIENKIPLHYKGCNKIGNFHPLHIKNNLIRFVETCDVELIYIGDFLNEYNVEKVDLLKIDTEGHDVNILNGLYNYLLEKDSDIYFPLKINFESNSNSNQKDVDDILNKFYSIGYELINRGYDTTIIYNK
jgi:FkbM family methyltransferase